MTAQSCTVAPRRITIGLTSARSTVLYQTDAFSSTVTSPMRFAVGAMKAVGCTRGDLPSNEKSGIRDSLPTWGWLRGPILPPSFGQGKCGQPRQVGPRGEWRPGPVDKAGGGGYP